MDRLHAMLVFSKVVETGSFAGAANALGLARPSVTVIIQNLESYLNTQLVQRSTRALRVTADGEDFYQQCTRVLRDVCEIEKSFNVRGMGLKGRLRVHVPAHIAKTFIVPRLDEFRESHPDVELLLCIGEQSADSLGGADCMVLIGAVPDSGLVARPLVTLPIVTAASENYLRRRGVPTAVKDLSNHRGIRHVTTASNRHCDMFFRVGVENICVRLESEFAVNDTETAIACAASGSGIVQSFGYLVQPYLTTGQLLEILPDCRPAAVPLFTVYTKANQRSAALRSFVEWVDRVIQQAPASGITGNSLAEPRTMQITHLSPHRPSHQGEARTLPAG